MFIFINNDKSIVGNRQSVEIPVEINNTIEKVVVEYVETNGQYNYQNCEYVRCFR